MKKLFSLAGISILVAAGWLFVASRMTAVADPFPTERIIHAPFDPLQKDREVQFHEGRVRRDPGGAIGWSMLSGAYLARSRESDSYADALKAEQAARKSLALRTEGNLGAQTRLINSLLQQHRFADALAADEKALKLWGPEPALNQLHADVLIELGRYDEAKKVLASRPDAFEYPSGEAIIAHLNLIEGRPADSLALLQKAYAEVDADAGPTDENLAWFVEKIGECLMSTGRTREAADAFQKATALYPKGYKAFGNLARLAALTGDWTDVIANGNRSIAIAPMADILALVGDAYGHQGNRQAAEEQYRKVVALAGKPSGPANGLHEFAGATGGHGHTLDRQYAMFCADHNRDLDGGYACAIRELQARRDVYAYDTLAWVCLKRGDKTEALLAIDRALGMGTLDAQMLDHGAAIYSANGRAAEAANFHVRAQQLGGVIAHAHP